MIRFLLILLLAPCVAAATVVSGTVTDAQGTDITGTAVISWPSFIEPGGELVVAGSLQVTITDGALSVTVAPNVGSTPSGTSYSVRIRSSDGRYATTDSWVVPNAATATISEVRTSTPPTPSAFVSLSAISTAGVSVGDIVSAQSGPTWARLAAGDEGEVLSIVSGVPAWSAAAGGSPTDAQYWLGAADATLSAEIVVNDLASLETAIGAYDFSDASNLDTGDLAAARMAANAVPALATGSQSATVDVYDFRCWDQTAVTGSSGCNFRAGAGQGTDPIMRVLSNDGATHYLSVTADNNIRVGKQAGGFTVGSHNTAVGSDAMAEVSVTAGTRNNVAVGSGALFDCDGCEGNVVVGHNAALRVTTADRNVMIGKDVNIGAPAGSAGSDNVFIGYQSGYDETGSNTLIIDNQDRGSEAAGRTDSLIYGIFDATPASQELHLNSKVFVGFGLDIEDGGTRPTCDASERGAVWFDEGGAGVKDDLSVCAKDAGDAYAWRSIY